MDSYIKSRTHRKRANTQTRTSISLCLTAVHCLILSISSTRQGSPMKLSVVACMLVLLAVANGAASHRDMLQTGTAAPGSPAPKNTTGKVLPKANATLPAGNKTHNSSAVGTAAASPAPSPMLVEKPANTTRPVNSAPSVNVNVTGNNTHNTSVAVGMQGPVAAKAPTVGELIKKAQAQANSSSPAPSPAIGVLIDGPSPPAPVPSPAPTNATPNATKTNGAGSMAAVSMAQWTLAALLLALGFMA